MYNDAWQEAQEWGGGQKGRENGENVKELCEERGIEKERGMRERVNLVVYIVRS